MIIEQLNHIPALLLPSNDEGGVICFGVVIFMIIVIALALSKSKNQQTEVIAQQKQATMTEIGAINSISIGEYLAGLPNIDTQVALHCAVSENDFVFLSKLGRELDRIPRDAINEIIVDTRAQVTQRLTATRIMTLGVFALAVPKQSKDYCLVIDWDDNDGNRQNSVFEFKKLPKIEKSEIDNQSRWLDSITQANRAANHLKKYVKEKALRLRANEKKCPFCAEVIKKEAVICRFCKSELVEDVASLTIDNKQR